MSDQQKYTTKLQGARVLIIGGSAGIGFGVAEACLEFGSTVIISSSSSKRIEDAISKLQKAYPSAATRISGHVCDLANEETLESNVAGLFEKVGEVDHVVFTAGDPLPNLPIREVTLEQMKKAGMVRFFAPLLVARFAASHMPASCASSYTICTGSVSQRPIPGWSVMGSYAGGHHSMARGLAVDLQPIRVNAVSPGAVDTTLWTMPQEEKEKIFEAMVQRMTTGRIGQVEDVTEAFLYAMRDRNCTGSVISTNGGALLT